MTQTTTHSLQQVTFNNILSINLLQDNLKKNFTIIVQKLHQLEDSIGIADRCRTIQRDLKNTNSKLDTVIKKLQADQSEALNKGQVQHLLKHKFMQVFHSADVMLSYQENIEKGLLLETMRKKIQFQTSQNLDKKIENKIRAINILDIIRRQSERQQYLNQHDDQQINKSKVQDKKEQEGRNVVSETISKTKRQLDDQSGKYLGQILKQQEQRKNSKKIKNEQIQHLKNKIASIQLYLSNKNIANMIGEKYGDEVKMNRKQTSNKQEFLRKQKKTLSKQEDRDVNYKHKKQEKQKKHKDSFLLNTQTQLNLQKRFRLDDNLAKHFDMKYQFNGLLKQLDSRMQNKVNRDVFLAYVQQVQDKMDTIRNSKGSVIFFYKMDWGQIKKSLLFLDNKINSLIQVIQQSEEQDPLIAKKKWACISCQKPYEKYNGKLGPHFNWDYLSNRKASPNKLGGYGQSLTSSRLKNIIDQRKGEIQDVL